MAVFRRPDETRRVIARREEGLRLAVEGGAPVREKLLPYGRQSIDDDDVAAVVAVLRSDWLTTGPKVGEFEEAFAHRVGAAYAVAFSSGTAALHGAVFAADVGTGDEVVTSPLTFCSTANMVLLQGGTPVFADVSEDTMCLHPDLAEQALTRRSRALLPVDYAGHPAHLAAFRELADRRGLILIEDACHALGASFADRPVGSVADLTVFSFHPVKHITTGEGGMVTTQDPELARRMRMFRSHGIDSDPRQRQRTGQWHYEMTELGLNYRLPDLMCALGLSQLPKLDANIARRREIAAAYGERLADIAGLQLPTVRPEVGPAWHLYPVRVHGIERETVFRALRAEGIGVNVHYVPVHLHPYYRQRFGYAGGEFPAAEAAYESLISLPMFHGMTDADVADVVEAVRKVVRRYAGEAA
jgi:perosamine synthetase